MYPSSKHAKITYPIRFYARTVSSLLQHFHFQGVFHRFEDVELFRWFSEQSLAMFWNALIANCDEVCSQKAFIVSTGNQNDAFKPNKQSNVVHYFIGRISFSFLQILKPSFKIWLKFFPVHFHKLKFLEISLVSSHLIPSNLSPCRHIFYPKTNCMHRQKIICRILHFFYNIFVRIFWTKFRRSNVR